MPDFSFIDAFEEAEDEGYGPDVPLPLGKHDATIKVGVTGTSKAGDFKISFLFEDAEGRTEWMSQTLTEKAKPYFAKACQQLGITAAMLDADADEAVKAPVGQRWNITVKESKTNSDFHNVYLNRRLDSSSEAGAAGGGGAEPSTPTPAPADQGTWDI